MDKLAFAKAVQVADELINDEEVRLQIQLISAALRARNGPAAFFWAQAEGALKGKGVLGDERYPAADKWSDKADAYHRSIVSRLDELVTRRLERGGFEYSHVDLAAIRLMLTSRFFERSRRVREV